MPELPTPIPHTVEAIYQALASRSRHSDSAGVPVGSIGAECERQLFYQFRWAAPPEQITGQKQRLFNTGLIEEERLLAELKATGAHVETHDPTTGQQFRVELANGWLRGKIDGRCTGLAEAPKAEHVVECKSHNDRSFKELLKHRDLKTAKPDHYAQVTVYMHAIGAQRGLYLAVNKNTDELYAERIHYDVTYALQLEAKAARIVRANEAPSKLHEDPKSKAAFACQWCPALGICHEGQWARRNCRTCLSSEFQDGAVVWCQHHKKRLTYDEQQKGCGAHLYLPSLVPGEQIDAGERWVAYDIGGQAWIDGQKAGRAA